MGNINQGILGGFNGKVGTVVGYTLRGKFCMRSYVGKIHNPRTEKQVLQRSRFSLLSKLSSEMLAAIQVGFAFRAKARRNSAVNNFMQVNKDNIALGSDGALSPDYSTLVLSGGTLVQPTFGSPSFSNSEKVDVSFSGNTEVSGSDENDLVYLYVYSPEADGGYLSTGVARKAGSISVSVPASWSGLKVHVWGFAANGSNASASTYLGSGTMA